MEKIKIATFLKERKIKYKPIDANSSGLNRIEKINFNGDIFLAPTQTNTAMILIKDGDLVISGINVEKGALAIYHGNENVLASIHYSAYEFDDSRIDITYLKWFLKSKTFKTLLLEQTGGGIKKEIKSKHLLPIEIYLPDLNTQRKIVNKIQLVNNDIESLNKQISDDLDSISDFRQSILQQAIEGKLVAQDSKDEPASVLLEKIKTEKEQLIKEKKSKKPKDLSPIKDEEKPFELPQGWEWCRLGDITDIFRGSSPRPKGSPMYWSDNRTEYHWITIKDISVNSNGKYIVDTNEFLTPKGSKLSTLVYQDEIIVAVSGSTTGKSCLTGISGYIYDGLACIRMINSKNSVHLYNYMQYIYQKLNNSKTGSAFPNINTDILKNMIYPLPPLSEQQRIVEKVDSLMALCDELEQEVKTAKKYASQLMEAVLQEAFTETDVKEDNVIEFPIEKASERETLLVVARGIMKQDTWEKIVDSVMD